MAKFKITWDELNDESKLKARIDAEIKAEIKFDAKTAIREIIEDTKSDAKFGTVAKITEPDKKIKAIKALIVVITVGLVGKDKPKIDELNKALGITKPDSNIQINYSQIAGVIYEQNKTEFSGDQTTKSSSSSTVPPSTSSASAKIAVISDIHSNLQAFTAVLADIANQGIPDSNIYCCGDIVGYGGNPNECVRIIKDRDIKWVLGNHEYEVVYPGELGNYREDVVKMFDWHRGVLEDDTKNYLASKSKDKRESYVISEDDFMVVHGELSQCHKFYYLLSEFLKNRYDKIIRENFEILMRDNKRILFIGHSHIPNTWIMRNDSINESVVAAISLAADDLAIVNVGSVGQPRDGNNRACYAIYDKESGKIEIRYVRVQYNIKAAQKAITDRIPDGYDKNAAIAMANRLAAGR